MKWLMLLIMLFVISAPMNGEVLKGGISYTVETAREIAFKNIERKIDINEYKAHLIDPNREKNKLAKKRNKRRFMDRSLTFFSDGSYAVRYNNAIYKGYYYNPAGNLIYIDIVEDSDYPRYRRKYDSKGNLYTVSLNISTNEEIVFDIDKTFIAHWIGNNCYNEKGELVNTRR